MMMLFVYTKANVGKVLARFYRVVMVYDSHVEIRAAARKHAFILRLPEEVKFK